MTSEVIAVKELTKFYGTQRGIIDLNFSVEKGEIFGFLGPNGAGKTTTIRVLLDFMRPSSGTAEIFGLDCADHDVEIKRLIGYLPGELHLYDSLKAKSFLEYMAQFRGNVDWNFVTRLSARLQADLSGQIKKMSQGNKQKIGLISALMHQPKLLILDEPTNGLDPLIQHEFYHLLEEARKGGTTIFMSSHNLPEVEKICDRVGIIKDGQLVIVETIKSLRQKAIRPLEVHFVKAPEEGAFRKIDGVKNLSVEDGTLRCSVVGSLDSFIKQLAKYEVTNIISQEPNLEEIFLTYYEKGKLS